MRKLSKLTGSATNGASLLMQDCEQTRQTIRHTIFAEFARLLCERLPLVSAERSTVPHCCVRSAVWPPVQWNLPKSSTPTFAILSRTLYLTLCSLEIPGDLPRIPLVYRWNRADSNSKIH